MAMSLLAIVVVSGALVTTRLAEDRLVDQVDRRLDGAAAPFDRGIDRGFDFRAPLSDPSSAQGAPPLRGPNGFNEFFVAAIDASGTVRVLGRPNIITGTSQNPPSLDVGQARTAAERTAGPFTVDAQHGDHSYRVIARSRADSDTILVLAAPLDTVEASTRELRTIAFIVAGIILAVLVLMTWWVLRLGIRPLKRMASAAVTIDDDDLTQRVPEAAPGTEAGDLSHAINTMLGRLEEAFGARAATDARLRRFVGDASHELRTPVQTIRGYAELFAAGGLADADQLEDAMRRTRLESERMARLIDDLLTLARFDQSRPIEHRPVDLAAIARDAVADAKVTASARTIDLDVAGDCSVAGDDALVRQVFANVVGNALVHTPDSAPITLTVRGGPDSVKVAIRDTGPGMDRDTADRAFERFVRADPARTRAHGGSGLGLAIVHDAVAAHGGHIRLESSAEFGTLVEFDLPRFGPGHRDASGTRPATEVEEHPDREDEDENADPGVDS